MNGNSHSSRRKLRGIAVGLAVATVATLAACAPTAAPESDDTSITIAVGALNPTYNPILGALGMGTKDTLDHDPLFDTLIKWNIDTQTAEPWLATDLVVSDDGQNISLTLRDDVDFVDGEHMTAEGIADYFNAVITSDQYVLGGALAGYDLEFEATGEYTVEITAATPVYFAAVADLLLGGTPVLSPAALDDPEGAQEVPVGSGPYVIDEFVPDVSISFVRNPDYWNPDAYPYDTVVIKVIADPVAKLNALKSGQVDAADLPIELAVEAEAAGLAVAEYGGAFATLIVGDPVNSEIPALRDVRVRQALALAFDRAAIVDAVYLGKGTTSSQAFAPGQPTYIEGGDDTYAYDLDRARELMAEAGYADGFDLVIPVSTGEASLQPIVQQSLADIGIRVTFESVATPADLFLQNIVTGKYPLVMMGSLDYVNSMRILTENFGERGVFVPTVQVSELVEIVKTGSADDSAEAGQELGQLLLDEVWYVPIAGVPSFWVSTSDIDVATKQVTSSYVVSLRDFQLSE